MRRYLGLDVGARRIGIAVTDPLGMTAQGLETLHRTNLQSDIAHILTLVDHYEAQGLVCGLPKNMNNTLGFKAEEVKAFIDALCDVRDLPIYWVDERLTTVQAEQVLIEADVSRKKRKKSVDKLAAVFILQLWMDQNIGDML